MYRLVWLIPLLILTACQKNMMKPDDQAGIDNPMVAVGDIIWADDGLAVAFHVKEVDGYQLYIENLRDEGDRKTLGKPSLHLPLNLYFMRKKGYILRQSQAEDGRFYFDKISLQQGHEIRILELQAAVLNCPQPVLAPNILPSANGRYLVFSSYSDCNTLQLDFLRAKSLASVAHYDLKVQASSLHWQAKDLIISDAAMQQAWRTQRKMAPELTDYQACVIPATQSSVQSKQHEVAFLDQEGLLSFSSAGSACTDNEP